jgi:DNA-binding beta-propeller fold protein YncE
MSVIFKPLPLILSSLFLLSACGSDSNNSDPEPIKKSALHALDIQCETVSRAIPQDTTGKLSLSLVDRYVSDSEFASSAAEIVSYDNCTDQLFVVNANDQRVDILSLENKTSQPHFSGSIQLQEAANASGIEIGAANSVSAKNGLLAVAIEAANKQQNGLIALYRLDTLSLVNTFEAGALPDMVLMSSDSQFILAANEGEPNSRYDIDPEGSVTLVNLSNGFEDDEAQVTQISFKDFNAGARRHDELPEQVRVSGPQGTTVAQDLEPEYITLDENNQLAYVALQENNALAVIDVNQAQVLAIKGLGLKSWDNNSGNQLDPSDKDGVVGNFSSFEQLAGLYMPDTISSYQVEGETYIVTANEGDSREYIYESTQQICIDAGHEWDGDDYTGTAQYNSALEDCISFTDEGRGKDLEVSVNHPLYNDLADKEVLGRIKVIMDQFELNESDTVLAFGGRSFSIWNDQAQLVFDSGDDIAKRVYGQDAQSLNATSDNNDLTETADNRSDDKGTEPEALEVATINGEVYAFVGLERQGGIMVYNITNPNAVLFQSYLNNRDFNHGVCTELDEGDCDNGIYNSDAGDLAPESIEYFNRENQHFIAVGNEVSGSTTIYKIAFDQ